MILKNDFIEMIQTIGFTEKDHIFEKFYPTYNCFMRVDVKNEKLIYPEEIVGRDRNTSFDSPENFVVFECVHRLLKKGYRPEHIELEKEWSLGHDKKSGRADICVYNEDKTSMLFIIECKTAGKEYNKAYKDTYADGGQLFSYWQQERSTKWLALYTSDFIDGEIIHKSPVISCTDDANIKELAKKDISVRLYEYANTAEEKYEVWKNTYNNQIYNDLIFQNDTIAYKIGIKPLYKKNLEEFNPEDKIVNQFEEILRHNNISDKENAFNKLIALFICKLVDEISKDEDDIVDFQYKQGTDTYESLQDRLQRLHQKGMKEFMKEEIFYVESDYAEKLFAQYTGQKRKEAIKDLNKTIRILKFYSNNDFSFKDVHNEELFYQNGKVLVEVVQLFQKYRIIYPSKHQFLGDLFEQLLNKGFKQNEGQFFTPTPLTRFIWDSLPLEKVMQYKDGYHFPRVIDYACGAGHFLTEAVEAINSFYEKKNSDEIINNDWVEKYIYGIEKDYRLARVSKVSMFMNGAGGANIIFGDGLENYPEKEIIPKTFDILVANPPYAVSSFKSHMKLKNNKFRLLPKISNDGSEIETLFVERIAQLVKAGGIAAVVLPSSILSNNSNSYIGAREQLLKHFYVRAITCFGNKTFGATGTNTVILFLEKMPEPPIRFKLVEDSANAILNNEDISNWEDEDIYLEYIKQIEVDDDLYRKIINESEDYNYFRKNNYFKNYIQSFENLTTIRYKKEQTAFKKLSLEKQKQWLNQSFYKYVKIKEKEKIMYFAMTYRQKVLIITSPADNEEQKKFLGYDWSNRKGNEGIVINKAGGMLYNDEDRYDENTLAALIRSSYKGQTKQLPEMKKYYRYADLKDMIDFTRVEFDKTINTNIQKVIKSKYQLFPLTELLEDTREIANSNVKVSNNNVLNVGDIPVISQNRDTIVSGYVNNVKPITDLPLILFGDHTCCFKYIDFPFVRGADGTQLIKANEEKVNPLYLYYILSTVDIENKNRYERHFKYLKKIQIPIPPIEIQKKIVEECRKVDKKYNTTSKKIKKYNDEIEEMFKEIDSLGEEKIRLNSDIFTLNIGKRVLKSQISTKGIPIYSANVKEPFGLTEKTFFDDFSIPTVIWGIDGDWDVNYIAPNIPFYPTDHCGTLRVNSESINPYYLAFALKSAGIRERYSRSNRASINRISAIRLEIPSIDKQNEFANKAQDINKLIQKLENELKDIKSEKNTILEKYL